MTNYHITLVPLRCLNAGTKAFCISVMTQITIYERPSKQNKPVVTA